MCNKAFAALLLLVPATLCAQSAGPVRVERAGAGTMQTDLGLGVVLNQSSTLPREAVLIHDTRLPVEIQQDVGIRTIYEDRGYRYSTSIRLNPTEDLTAVEVRYVIFDVWGDKVRTLSLTEVSDMKAGVPKELKPRWNLYSESEAKPHYASIAYVARVRTAAGRVVYADPSPALAEALKFSKKFTAADLEPKAPEK
jgi:hypothetical protein